METEHIRAYEEMLKKLRATCTEREQLQQQLAALKDDKGDKT